MPIDPPKVAGPAIVFVRDSGQLGAACVYDAVVDGVVVGQLRQGQTLVKTVSPGKRRVAVENTSLVCANKKMSKVVDVSDTPTVLRLGFSGSQTFFEQVE